MAQKMRSAKRGLVAPNGKSSKLTEMQWLQVRTKAFNAWFGDWERVAELTFDGSEYNNKKCLEVLSAEAGNPFINKETGISATINSRQRNKITSGKAQRNMCLVAFLQVFIIIWLRIYVLYLSMLLKSGNMRIEKEVKIYWQLGGLFALYR